MADANEGLVPDWWTMPHGIERELAKYNQCEEPGDCDHDHDNAIEYMREQELAELRAELATATARAETAEAAYHQLDSAQAAAGSYAGRAEAAEAENAELRARLGADAYTTLLRHRNVVLEVMAERDKARAELSQARQRLAELGEGQDGT